MHAITVTCHSIPSSRMAYPGRKSGFLKRRRRFGLIPSNPLLRLRCLWDSAWRATALRAWCGCRSAPKSWVSPREIRRQTEEPPSTIIIPKPAFLSPRQLILMEKLYEFLILRDGKICWIKIGGQLWSTKESLCTRPALVQEDRETLQVTWNVRGIPNEKEAKYFCLQHLGSRLLLQSWPKKVCSRLRDVATAPAGGITQPRTHFLANSRF